MPDFGNLLDPPLPSNLEISSESNTQMEALVLDQDSQLGFPILQKEDELILENNGCGELNLGNNGCVELEMSPKRPDFGNLLNPPSNLEISSESDTQMEALVFDQDSHLGIPILQKEDNFEQKEDELILENNGCGELNLENNGCNELNPENSGYGELNLENNGCSELNLENNGCGELNLENNGCAELNLENSGCAELEMSPKVPDFGNILDPPSNLEISSESDTQMEALVFDQNSHMGFPILQKEDNLEQKEDELNVGENGCAELEKKENELVLEKYGCDELKLENNGCGELEKKEDELIIENNGCGVFEMKKDELIIENNGCGELEKKEDELIIENNGCGVLEMKEEELILENNGCVELEMNHFDNLLDPPLLSNLEVSSESETQIPVDQNSQLVFPILQKEENLIPENNGCCELEQKENELILENNGCVELNLENNGCGELEQKEDELILENNGCVVLEMKENELNLENNGCGELEAKEDELILENNGCVELETKEDELILENNGCGELEIRGLRPSGGGSVAKNNLDEFVKDWVDRKVNAGIDKRNCVLPFLVHAPKLVECSVCRRLIFPGEEVECSVRDCTVVFHLTCAKETLGLSSPKTFKCPQHVCYVCNKKIHLWRCIRCPLASHDKCAAFPEHVVHLNDQPGRVICWKHPSDWRLEKEIFNNLPLPYVEEEFKIDINWKDMIDNRFEPPPYVHIKRNVYLIKKKRDGINAGIGCTSCRSTECSDNCVCRVQCISCSKVCHCSDMCSNRPFRRDRKVKLVKTELCGWGVVAAESINKGDFIIEYIGEVIDDALCEKRLWDMKYKGVKNFYMCELRKDFIIDATFKGNLSRFLNHSCDPNCKLEKWQVEGETRVGVFAARSIEVGEPLTYDYRFVQFGPEVKCHCGASNCQGYLGSKKKIISKLDICWGSKRKRTSTSCLATIKVNSC